MTLQEAISILSMAANAHALTTGEEWYQALRLGIEALIQQRERQDLHTGRHPVGTSGGG